MSTIARAMWCGFLLGLLLTACTSAQSREFKSDEWGFAVHFPAKPEHRTITVNTAAGPRDMHVYQVSDKQMSFTVSVTVFPSEQLEQLGATAALDNARDGTVANVQGKLLSELIVEVDGYRGRELKISAAGGKAAIRTKLFLVSARLYQILVVAPTDEAYAPRVRRFLDSFKIL